MSADYEIKRTDGSTETVRAHNYMQAIYLAGGLKEGSNIAGVQRLPPKKKLSRRDEIVAQARREQAAKDAAIVRNFEFNAGHQYTQDDIDEQQEQCAKEIESDGQ